MNDLKRTFFLLIFLLTIFSGSIDIKFDKKSYVAGEPINVKVSVDMPLNVKKGVLILALMRNGNTIPLKKYTVNGKHEEFFYSSNQESRLKIIPPGEYLILAILKDENGRTLERKIFKFSVYPEKKSQFSKILIFLGILSIFLIFGFFLGRSYYRRPKEEVLKEVSKPQEAIQEAVSPVHQLLSELEIAEKKFPDINRKLRDTEQKIKELDEKYRSGEISKIAYENIGFELRKKKVDLEEEKNRIYNVYEDAKKELNKLEIDLETLEASFLMGNIDKEKYEKEKRELESLITKFKTHMEKSEFASRD